MKLNEVFIFQAKTDPDRRQHRVPPAIERYAPEGTRAPQEHGVGCDQSDEKERRDKVPEDHVALEQQSADVLCPGRVRHVRGDPQPGYEAHHQCDKDCPVQYNGRQVRFRLCHA